MSTPSPGGADIGSAPHASTRIGERALKIYVESQDGVIALSGRVGDSELRDRAVRVARETVGVREVYDLLEVRPAMSGEHDD